MAERPSQEPQLIATAPKTGEPLLLYSPVAKWHICTWMPGAYMIDPMTGQREHEQAHWMCWSNRNRKDFDWTHWLPYPQEPADG